MQMGKNWTIRLATFSLWLLAAASVVYWGLKFVQGTAAPANTLVVAATPSTPAVDSAALARGLGGGPVAQVASAEVAAPSTLNASRFVLTGVVAAKPNRQGIALIAVDGKPARPYRVGAQVVDGLLLQSVVGTQVALASAADVPAALTLDMPKLTTAIVGTAIPVRPVPAPVAPVAPTPTLPAALPAPVVVPGTVSVAPDLANPPAGFGQNPARLGASRPRLNRESVVQDQSNPAGAATQ
jgi:general secretion pathway protein C